MSKFILFDDTIINTRRISNVYTCENQYNKDKDKYCIVLLERKRDYPTNHYECYKEPIQRNKRFEKLKQIFDIQE